VNAESCRYFGDWLIDKVGGWDAEARRRNEPQGVTEGEVGHGDEIGEGEEDAGENGDSEEADVD